MNFKRKKSKRSVKCTLCTKYRWLGNSKERRSAHDKRIHEIVKEMESFDLEADLKKNWNQIDEHTYQNKHNPDLGLSVG